MEKIYKVALGKARCAVDLGDGSERGEYVEQDYILRKLGRPHRSISLMYCYYPFDEHFPKRISEAVSGEGITYQWDYPYDDYFPYRGGLEGDTSGEPFNFMRDIRRHGQDVTLTITMDPAVTDEQLRAIGNDLRPFGRMLLRINHEATGNWFSFTKRASYQEIADYYCRAARIIKEQAPNVRTILCIGGIEDPDSDEMVKEEEFTQAVRETDIWSVDKYMSLHWEWPYDTAITGGSTHFRSSVKEVYELSKRSYERFRYLNGGIAKPMVMSELNSDGDVTGPYEQAEMVQLFADMLKADKDDWLDGFTFYQFRDRGRLGLEAEDPNNSNVGVEQPVMQVYRNIIHDDYFQPSLKRGEETALPVRLRWSGAEDSDGIEIPIRVKSQPHFCELTFADNNNLMLEFNGMWFYKSPEAGFIDLMPAFYARPFSGESEIPLRIFAPPASGENDLSVPDGLLNYRCTINKLPELRIEYGPVEPSKDKNGE